MNAKFLNDRLSVQDIVRITTNEAIGVIGYVSYIDVANDGIEIEGIKDPEIKKQIDNLIEYDKALFAISDIKHVFKLNLIKSTKPHGKENNRDQI